MAKFVKLYEEFITDVEETLAKEIQVTFRFLLKEGIKGETLKNKIETKFIESIKPPFNYKNLTFKKFEIDHIGDIEEDSRIISEYAIKADVVINDESELNSKVIERHIKKGIERFLRLENKVYFSDEVERTTIIEYQYNN